MLADADVQTLMEPIQKYLQQGNTTREKRLLATSAVRFMHADGCPYEQVDSLSLLWQQVEQGRAAGWQSPLILRLPSDGDSIAEPAVKLTIRKPITP